MDTYRQPPAQPGNGQAMTYAEFYRQLFAKKQRPEAPQPAASGRPAPFVPYQGPALSTEEFYRELFAKKQPPAAPEPPRPTPARPYDPACPEAISTKDYYRELFAKQEKPLALGPRPGLEPPALPARFTRVRGGNRLVRFELLVAEDGRIAARHEDVAGQCTFFAYMYDDTGHLAQVWRNGKLAEEYAYDARGARVASWNARQGQWAYAYDQGGRLTSAGPWKFAYAEDGGLRQAWTPALSYNFAANQPGGLSRIALPGGRVLRSETIAPGLPVEKYVDAVPVESLTWRSPLQLATYRDHRTGARMQFHYTQGRLPQAVTVQDPQGTTTYLLGYDQVGSLKAVAAMDGESEGRVVKVMDYDAFGNVLSDSNPALFLPLGFAGGLRDRFTGLVRFCHRDYDPTVGRFTAPDPLGDTGGDHDLYDYCVDEPVGRVDPEGLQDKGFWSGVWDSVASGWDSIASTFTSDTPPNPETEAEALKKMDTVSRDVDSALGKAKDAVNSVRTEAGDIAKGADIAGKITLPQEAKDEAIRIGNKIEASKSRSDYLLKEMSQDNATAVEELQEHGLPEHRRSILETPGELLRFYWDKYSPLPAPPKP